VSIAGALFGIAWITAGQSRETASWTIGGQNLDNSRSLPNESTITSANVNTLATKWQFYNGRGCIGDADGCERCDLFPGSGRQPRRAQAGRRKPPLVTSDRGLRRLRRAIARVSPVVHGMGIIIGGLQSSSLPHDGANIMAIDRSTGNLHWISKYAGPSMPNSWRNTSRSVEELDSTQIGSFLVLGTWRKAS
jgi:hypothetical protein